MAPPLTIPDTLYPTHAAILREHHFETAGDLGRVIRSDEYDGVRILYAITNPERTALVYIGESEEGRDLRGRLKSHMDSRAKAGHVEKTSLVFVHVMVTEYLVLDRFEQETGALPLLNRRKVAKHMTRNWQRNGANEAEEYRAMMDARKAAAEAPERPAKASAKATPRKSTTRR